MNPSEEFDKVTKILKELKENNIKTAEEVYNDIYFNYKGDENIVLHAMREYAKQYIDFAAKKADIVYHDPEYVGIDEESILEIKKYII